MSAAWNRECPFEHVTVILTSLEEMMMIGYFVGRILTLSGTLFLWLCFIVPNITRA